MDKARRWLKTTLGYEFDDTELFAQALTHRSADGISNERLEFLGDAVLDTVVSEAVFNARPDAPEGDLSRLRSSLVKDTALAALAVELGLGEHLQLGGGERRSGGHRRTSILADALEALFGAVYLDAGFPAARLVIERAYADRLRDLPDAASLRDSKTRLQEWLQARGMSLPEYELVATHGKAHQRRFAVRCSVPDAGCETTGEGSSRRKAEQQSAAGMLALLAGGADD